MRNPSHDDEYRGPDIPSDLGEQLQVALGLHERPGTFGDWVEELAAITARDDVEVGLEALCTTDESPHRARFDGRAQHYQCVQDAFVVPFLARDVETVEIETESPVDGEPIGFTVTDDGIDVEPSGVVMSFGVAADAERPADDLPSPVLAYGRVCPYGNAFASQDEYERWANQVDALTMAVSPSDTLEFARAVGELG